MGLFKNMINNIQQPTFYVDGFKGINNRIDPTRLGLEFQIQAINVLCDNAKYLTRRPGIKAVTDGIKDIYGTHNGRLLAIDDIDQLIEFHTDESYTVLMTGVTGAPFQWAELGYAFFVQSNIARWAIYPNRLLAWGALCPTSSAVTYPLGDPISYPPPIGNIFCAWRNQMVVGVWEPDRDRSVLYLSRPDFPHEFRLDRDFIIIPGQVTLLDSVSSGLVIGTDRAVFVKPIDSQLQKEADYGVPLGASVHDDRDKLYFWTQRGLCRAFPFENLTDSNLVVSLREHATAGILPYQGSTYAIVNQTGALKSNQITKAYVPLEIVYEYP